MLPYNVYPGAHEIYYSRFVSGSWSLPALVTSIPGWSTEIDTDSTGGIHLVLHDEIGAGDRDIYYTKFDGNAWTPAAIVPPSTVSAIRPRIVINGSGHPEILFVGNSYSLFHRTWDGVGWSEARKIHSDRRFTSFSKWNDILVSRLDEIIYAFVNTSFSSNSYPINVLNSSIDESLFPDRPAVTADLVNDEQTLSATFTSPIPEDIYRYKFSVGTAPGNDDPYAWTNWSTATAYNYLLNELRPLLDRQAYCVSALALGNNGYKSAVNASDPVYTAGPPTISIDAPADGSVFTAVEQIIFIGTANDIEDGDIGGSIAWSSDLDGQLGVGSSVTAGLLTEGMHVVTATVSDSGNLSATASISVRVNNSPPVANDDAAATRRKVAVVIDVLANDSDADGDSLFVSSVTQPQNGTVSNNGVNISYKPVPKFTGSETFTYTVDDGNGGFASATVTVTVTKK